MFSYRRLMPCFGGIVLIGAVSWIFASLGGKPHLMGTACSNCHLVGNGNEVNPAQAYKLVASQEFLCGICHKNLKQMSHPSGFAPRNKLPAEYPVDWKKDMTCSTCHVVHGTNPGLLRGEKRGKDLCLSCHDNTFFDNMKDSGISLQQSGHMNVGDDSGDRGEIDSYSLQCMGCHDSQSDAGGVRMGRNNIVLHSTGGANHPIGIAYPAFSKNSEFRPKNMLSNLILLPNGKLSCLSCHQVYKKVHGQLVMPNVGSSLCLQCHNP